MTTYIVIPTYNEAENLPQMTSALFSLSLSGLRILIVDDNSPDGTGEIADKIAEEKDGSVSVIHRQGKLGLGTAYLTGFQRALDRGAERIVQMDADFSHNPRRVIDLLEGLNQADMVLGSRYVKGGRLDETWPIWRKWLSAFGNLYARTILGVPVRDITGGFRAWKRGTLEALPFNRVKSEGYAFQVEMAYLAHLMGFTIEEVPIYFADRKEGASKMSFQIQFEAALRVWSILMDYRDIR